MSNVKIYHNTHTLFYRNPFGALPCEDELELRLMVRAIDPLKEVILELYREEAGGGKSVSRIQLELMQVKGEERIYNTKLRMPSFPCLLWYFFRVVTGDNKTLYYGSDATGMGGAGQVAETLPPPYQVTVYKKDFSTPSWFKDAVVYQIFVERFCNGMEEGKVLNPKKNSLLHSHWDNKTFYIREMGSGKVARWDFFGGNLYGVRKKLPYLKALGIKAIYFNPLFESPSNHKYDTGDYHKIDPMFGDNAFFEQLCSEAEKLGISVILDGVFSHTGSDSIYFNKEGNYESLGAFQSPESPYFSWFSFSEYPDSYECWWDIDNMPNVNELEPSYLRFIIFDENSVLKYWGKKGIKGWRLDVVDELPGDFLQEFRRALKEMDPDSVLIGEVWEDASHKESYDRRREYLLGKELDGVTNYPFRNALVDFLLLKRNAVEINRTLMSIYENYPRPHFFSLLNLIGGHDVARIFTVLGEALPQELDREHKRSIQKTRLKAAALWQFTFPGAPCLYYGDEVGSEGGKDPENRGTFPWGEEDGELQDWYRRLIALRNHYDVLRTGRWLPLHAEEKVYCFVRLIEGGRDEFGAEKKNNMALTAINADPWNQAFLLLDISAWSQERMIDPLDGYSEIPLQEGKLALTLEPLEGKVLLRERWGDNYGSRRESGILLHLTSLPSPYGVGGMGKEAFEFIDFLKSSGQSLWQILPLNPPALGESPYQCFSAFAGNPLLIDPLRLQEEGLLSHSDLESMPLLEEDRADFELARRIKEPLLRQAFIRFLERGEENSPRYREFCDSNSNWLEDYALFSALKVHFEGKRWNAWEEGAAFRQPEELERYRRLLKKEVEFTKFLQYIFFTQWRKIRDYAASKEVKIIGDLPIFVAHDSCDVWANPSLFRLDEKGDPLTMAGVPPDYFSETGQLWGNPHYRWEEMEKDDFLWWRERLKVLAGQVDIIRIDHFRAFEAYWEVPAGAETAVNGQWVKGPGEIFFASVERDLGALPLIAEDLGYITPAVDELRVRFDLPGMKILQFALEEGNGGFHFPLYDKNNVLYTGTHDNDTLLGWYRNKGRKGLLPGKPQEEKDIPWFFIDMALRSDAEKVIIPLQDIFGLGSEGRMNSPGTIENNWRWRFSSRWLKTGRGEKLRKLTQKYNRGL